MSHQQVYKLPPMLVNGQLRNGNSASSASASNGGDGDKIRQLQRLLLGVTKAIQTYLLEDIATVMESIHDMDDVKRYLSVVKCIARVNQHLAELPVPDAFAYEEPAFGAGSEEFVSFQRRMHYALWLIHAKLHVLPPFIVSTDGPAQLVALAKALKIAKAELQTFAVQLSELDALSEPAAAAAAAAAAANGSSPRDDDVNGDENRSRRRGDGSDDDDDDDGSGRKPRRNVQRSPDDSSSSSDLEEDDDDEFDENGQRVTRAAPAGTEQQTLPPPIDHLTRRSSSDDLFRTKVRSNDASSSGEEAADDSRSGDLKHHIKNVDDDEVANYLDDQDDTVGSMSSGSSSSSTTSSSGSSSDDDDDDGDDDDDDDDDDDYRIEGGIEVVFVDDENDNDDAIVVIDGSPPRVVEPTITTVVDERPLSPVAAAAAAAASSSSSSLAAVVASPGVVATIVASPVRAASPKLRSPSPPVVATTTDDDDQQQQDGVTDDGEVPGSPGDATSEASFLRRGKPKRTHRRPASPLSSAPKVSPSTSDDGELGGSRAARSRLSTVTTARAVEEVTAVAASLTNEPVVLVRTPTPPVVLDAAGDVDPVATLRKSPSSPSHAIGERHPSPRRNSPRLSVVGASHQASPPPLPPTPTEASPPRAIVSSNGRARHTRSLSLDTPNAAGDEQHLSPELEAPINDALHREVVQLRERVGELERSNHYSASTKSSSSSGSLLSSDASTSASGSSSESDDDSNPGELPPRGDKAALTRRVQRRRRRAKHKRMDTLDTLTPPDTTPRVAPPQDTFMVAVLPATTCLRAPFG